jgi:lipoprotein signal peptidase
MPDLTTSNFRSTAALCRFYLTTLLGLVVDLWSKSYAFTHLAVQGGPPSSKPTVYAFIPGWVEFELTRNEGAVFGIGQGQQFLFIAVSVAAIGFLTYLFAVSGRQKFYQFILGLLLAGVLGNMYDRIQYGYVRDMIHALPRWPKLFPWIFNVADMMLCTGVGLMVAHSLLSSPNQELHAANIQPSAEQP